MPAASVSGLASDRPETGRWVQLVIGVACMVMIANLQYGWTLFVQPMNAAHGWSLTDIQIAFSLFVALETWLTPIEGWIADWIGPKNGARLVVAFGGVMIAVGWIVNSIAQTLPMLYLGAALSGIGAGAIYATCVGNSVKWFPDRRGLAVGLTAAGFGAGAALTVVPIRSVIAAYGYGAAFFWFGLVQGAIVFVVAWWMRAPLAGEVPAGAPSRVIQTSESYSPQAMLMTPVFWVLYVMFVIVSASGLMATAQIALIARDFHVADAAVAFGMSTLTLALLVDNVANGAARPLFGWISDQIGREYTMAIGTTPWAFIVFAGLIFLTWGEIFSLFPSTCTDSFGPKYATANLSFLYTAKGLSAFLVPLANLIAAATGSWHEVFVVTASMNFAVVALALLVLRPLRARRIRAAEPHAIVSAR
jgi:OFA family oxalate/formate antiporter-like MFS transporter